ncbi:MAG: PD-(D/E)XK nuclease family protein [Muribaculaceae bacterium]|nr:PD-(D/E)XK nuclease family protein [Muribaculaceae bacterium]
MDMIQLELWKFHDIHFDPVPHKYTDSKGTAFTSVTSWVHEFSPPQDWDEIAKKSAAKNGCTPEELRAKWKRAGDYSCDLGTEVHAYMENLMQHKRYVPHFDMAKWPEMPADYDSRIPACNAAYQMITQTYIPVREELIVHNSDWGLCGTIDLLAYNTKTGQYAILDYKTNKEIKNDNPWQRMMPPFSDFPDANYYHYSLQLSTYKAIVEKKTNIRIGDLMLIHITAKGPVMIPCIDVSTRALELLETNPPIKRKLFKDVQSVEITDGNQAR